MPILINIGSCLITLKSPFSELISPPSIASSPARPRVFIHPVHISTLSPLPTRSSRAERDWGTCPLTIEKTPSPEATSRTLCPFLRAASASLMKVCVCSKLYGVVEKKKTNSFCIVLSPYLPAANAARNSSLFLTFVVLRDTCPSLLRGSMPERADPQNTLFLRLPRCPGPWGP